MSFGALIEKFRAVALDRVEQMNVLLVQLEHDPANAEATEELLREIHTLKGEAKMMGFADVNLVAHQTEHLLVLATERDFKVPQLLVDTAFEGFDIVRQLLTKSAGATDPPIDLSRFVDRVTRARQLDGTRADQASDQPAEHISDDPSTQPDDPPTERVDAADQTPSDIEQPHLSAPVADLFEELAESLAHESVSTSAEPSAQASSADKSIDGSDGWDAAWDEPEEGLSAAEFSEFMEESSSGELQREDFRRSSTSVNRRATRTRVDASLGVDELGRPGQSAPESSAASSAHTDRLLRLQVGHSLRVDLEKLERLGDVAGEVLLLSRRINYGLGGLNEIREAFRRWMQRLEGRLPGHTLSELRNLMHRFDDFSSGARNEIYLIGARTAQLDQEVRGLRHVPLAQVMSHYPRAVRDLAREQGKRVRLVHAFGKVEVDRVLLSALSEPMLHLIRNAVDHGVEPPEERESLGKEREAMIRLLAQYVGDSIRVVIEDDGRGIDPQVLREKAVERGLLPPARAQGLSDQEALALIFEPGFSTRDEVSEISGRGIGMDVVRRQIIEIGGYIEVESEVGQGTQVTITLPASSAVSQVLMVEIAGRSFALAAKQVLRVGAIQPGELLISHGGVFAEFDGEMVGLRDWSRLLNFSGEPIHETKLDEPMTVLLLRRGRQRVAVWVDRVLGEREAMSRPFGEFLRGVKYCRGVALTDAGEVVPLLHLAELLAADLSPNLSSPPAKITAPESAQPEAPRITAGTQIAQTDEHAADPPPAELFAQGDDSLPGFEHIPAELGSTSSSAFIDTPLAREQTILVVEDSEITRDLVTGILARHGFQIRVAKDGEEGWQVLQREPIDLLLTDIQMPRLDGLQLLQRVRQSRDYATLPVVILTTMGDPADKAHAMRLGADGYLVKLNFQENDLLDMVRRQV